MGWWRKKKSEEDDGKKRLVQENGEVVLEKLIEYCNGKSNPIKTFSASQILRATDNFSSNNSLVLQASSSYQCYRGMLEDRPVLVKKWVRNYSPYSGKTCCDIAISSMVSGHKNLLKLLGCCLEFPNSVLVYEYAQSIMCRGKSKYLDHNYMVMGIVTENTDVCGFGAFMLTLLTALRPSLVVKLYKDSPTELVEGGGFVGMVDPKVLESYKEEEIWQFKTFFILSLRCIGCVGEVPQMIEVAKELNKMLVHAKTESSII